MHLEEDQVRERDICKSTGPGGMDAPTSTEGAGRCDCEAALQPVVNHSNREKCLMTGGNITPIFRKSKKEEPGNYRLISLTLISEVVMEQLMLELFPDTWRMQR